MIYIIKKLINFIKQENRKNFDKINKNKNIIEDKIKSLDINDDEKDFNNLYIIEYAKKIKKELLNNLKKCENDYLVIIDDNYGIISSIEDYIEIYSDRINLNNLEIKVFAGPDAAKKFLDFAKDNFNCIKYAIFDITLNEKIKLLDYFFTIDGIDLAIFLQKLKENTNNSDFNFIFYTGNILNRKINYIKNKIKKYEFIFKDSITNKIIQKDFLKSIEQLEILFKKLNLLKE